MSGFLKANAKHQGQLALKSLWNQLDREWIRAASPTVDEVLHRTIGERIAKLDDSRKLPPLIANWSALPQAAFQIGKLLASDPTSAVVLVSDMRVDTPPGRPGESLCAGVPIPAGRGDVPSLFGKCFIAALEILPEGLDVRVVDVRKPVLADGGRPLFAVIWSRNAEYSSLLAANIEHGLGAAVDAAELILVSAQPQIKCAALGRCVYWKRSDVVARHVVEDGSRACSFYAPSPSGDHQIRCRLAEPDRRDDAAPALLIASRTGVKEMSMAPAILKVGPSTLDSRVSLPKLGPRSTDVRFALTYRWQFAPDFNDRLLALLGPRWGADPEYRDAFLTTAKVIAKSMEQAAPVCNETWALHYSR